MKKTILALTIAAAAFAQTSGHEAPVMSILNDIHAVNSLDKTLAFYRAVFGLDAQPRPFPNPGVPALTNSPGVSLRLAVLKFPNASFGFELTEFSGIERKPGRPTHTDPGAGTMVLRVRNLDNVVAAAKKAGAEIVTRSQAPVKVSDSGVRSILLRDPDGYFVEAVEAVGEGSAPASGIVQSVGMGFTTADLEVTRKFYHDLLGFELKGNMAYASTPAVADLVGAPKGSESREMTGVIPGTTAPIAFYEWKGMPRKPFHLRVPDPGAPAMCLRVRDLDAVLTRMRAAGVPVLSAKGEVVQFTPTVRNIFVEDPNGVNLELYESKQ